MEGLDLGIKQRVNFTNSSPVTQPSDFEPAEKRRLLNNNKKSFDKNYCQSVQAYMAPGFIQSGEKNCSVKEYIAKLNAAGLKEGKDFEIRGSDSELNFELEITLKDLLGRDIKSTFWNNGLEAENYEGYYKYSYNPKDSSYKKTSAYTNDNKLKYISEITKSVPQKSFTQEGLEYSSKPKDYIANLKSQGKNFETSKEIFGTGNEHKTYTIDIQNNKGNLEKSVQWYAVNGKLISVDQDFYDENELVQKRLSFYPDGSTEMTHYF